MIDAPSFSSLFFYGSIIAAFNVNITTLVKIHRKKSLIQFLTIFFWFKLLVVGQCMSNLLWIAVLCAKKAILLTDSTTFLTQLMYVAQVFIIMHYQVLGRFMQLLIYPQHEYHLLQKISICVSTFFSCYLSYLALMSPAYTLIKGSRHSLFESLILYIIAFILINILLLPNLYNVLKVTRSNRPPKMVLHLLKTISYGLICPFLLGQLLLTNALIWNPDARILQYIASFGNILLAAALYHTLKMILRTNPIFQTYDSHAINAQKSTVENFRVALEGFAQCQSIEGLYEVLFTFFQQEFRLPARAINMYIATDHPEAELVVSRFLENTAPHHNSPSPKNILAYDELAFNLFYEENNAELIQLNFLQDIESDIFIPIYHHTEIVAYVTTALGSRPNAIYSFNEQNCMVIFASFLGNMISAFNKNTIDQFLKRKIIFENELYLRHQEIALYKESIKESFNAPQQKEPDVIVYKKGKFHFLTHAITQNFLKTSSTHIATARINRIFAPVVKEVEQDVKAKTCLIKTANNLELLTVGAKNYDRKGIVLSVLQADIADKITNYYQYLSAKDDILYLLYLDNTCLGRHLSSLIPGVGPQLLALKIALCKAVLKRESVFFQAHHTDWPLILTLFDPLVPQKKIMALSADELLYAIAPHKKNQKPVIDTPKALHVLQELCSHHDIIVIKNMQTLDKQLQTIILSLIQSHILEPDTEHMSRFFFVDQKNLITLHHEGHLDTNFFEYLKGIHTVHIPGAPPFDKDDLLTLIEGFVYQTSKQPLLFTHYDKEQIAQKNPPSINELFRLVAAATKRKTKANDAYVHTFVEQSEDKKAPTHLDKHTLKDVKSMLELWQRFGSYHKIAAHLGVNASSVLRRCRQFGIGKETQS